MNSSRKRYSGKPEVRKPARDGRIDKREAREQKWRDRDKEDEERAAALVSSKAVPYRATAAH